MTGNKKVSLEQTFQILTVAELKSLCKTLDIVGTSNKRKSEIIDILMKHLMNQNIFQSICLYSRPNEMKAFQKVIRNEQLTKEMEFDLLYWLHIGYCVIDEDNHVLVMEEVKELFQQLDKEFWEQFERIHLVLNHIYSAIHLYGVIPIDDFLDIFNRMNLKELTEEELRHLYLMIDVRPDLLSFVLTEDLLFDELLLDVESGVFAYEEVYDQQGIGEYYVPTQVEFLKYEDDNYFEKTKEYENLLDYFVTIYHESKIIAEDLCNDIVYSIRLGYPLEDIKETLFEKGIEIDQFSQEHFTNLLKQLIDNTRTMFSRGYTLNELWDSSCYISTSEKSHRKTKTLESSLCDYNNVIPFPGNRK